jgi:hypothetical protein
MSHAALVSQTVLLSLATCDPALPHDEVAKRVGDELAHVTMRPPQLCAAAVFSALQAAPDTPSLVARVTRALQPSTLA